MHDVLILADPEAVAEAATELIVAAAAAAVEIQDRFVLALTHTPALAPVYRRLASDDHLGRVPWNRTWVVLGDETCVAPDDPASHYRAARAALLDAVPVDPDRVLRIEGETPQASRAAHFHEERLRALFPGEDWPGIDVALLGVEPDGRTASMLPACDALAIDDRWVAAAYEPDRDLWRVALTIPAWNAARQTLFVVTGRDRADRAAEAFGDPCIGPTLPAQHVVPVDGTRLVLVDEDAAALLGEFV